MLKIIHKIRNNSFFRDSSSAFVLKVYAASIGFIISVLLSRKLGAEQLGLYYLALSVVSILIPLCGMGMNNGLVRMLSPINSKERAGEINLILLLSLIIVLSVSVLVVVFMLFSVDTISSLFGMTGKFNGVLSLILLSMPMMLSIVMLSHAMQAMGSIKIAMLVSGALQNTILLLLIYLLLDVSSSHELGLLHIGTVAATLLISIIYWLNKNRCNPLVYTSIERYKGVGEALLKASIPIYVVQILMEVNSQLSNLMIGYYLTAEEVSYFGVASRFSLITGFLFIAVNRVLAPRIAQRYSLGDMVGLEKEVRQAVLVLLLGGLPIISVMFFFSEYIILLYGENFLPAAQILKVLALAHGINIITGPADQILQMTGKSNILKWNVIISLIITAGVNFYLIPKFGAVGAAYSVLISMIVLNFLTVLSVRKYLNIKMFRYL